MKHLHPTTGVMVICNVFGFIFRCLLGLAVKGISLETPKKLKHVSIEYRGLCKCNQKVDISVCSGEQVLRHKTDAQ